MVKGETVPCTKEEIDALLNVAIKDEFYYMMFKVAIKTGRRLGEYWGVKNRVTGEWEGGVKVSDIDFERGVMMTRVLKRKRRIEKEAILNDEIINLVKSYVSRNGLKLDDYLFRKVSMRQIQYKVEYCARKAKINHKVTFHNFRHYFVTELFKKGWTYDKIAKLTGHSTVSTLAVYDHSVASDIAADAREAIRDL